MGDCCASATARLVAMLVLPTPPLGESTVNVRDRKSTGAVGLASLSGSPAVAGVRASSRARRPASRLGSSMLGATSRMPERIASSMTSFSVAATSTRSTSGRTAATSRARAMEACSGTAAVRIIASGITVGSSPRRKLEESPCMASAPSATH